MFLVPTGVDTDETHSDSYDVPKSNPKADKISLSNFKKLSEKFKNAQSIEELKDIYEEAKKTELNKEHTDLLIAIKDEKKTTLLNNTTTNE